MGLFSYVVSRDYGFAPNPFYGVCTLVTCKPRIRRMAQPGDWIVGIAPKRRGNRLIFYMHVEERLHFDNYWVDPRFMMKRPRLNVGRMQAFGDNIYHTDANTGEWLQEDSHHSLPTGEANPVNIKTDTSAPYALIGRQFTYWGKDGPSLPAHLSGPGPDTLIVGRSERSHFSEAFKAEVIDWIQSTGFQGRVGEPRDWKKLHGQKK